MSPPKTLVSPAQFEAIFQEAPHLQALLRVCRSQHASVYLVGGAVRDLLHKGTLSTDLDVVVPAESAKAIAETVSQALQGKCICLDEQFRIYRVILFPNLEMLDIAGCIGKDIHEDLLRRDLTVNAIAYDFETQSLLDPTGGQHDLEQGLIRMVSEANLLDDSLRLLRVFRIGAELGFRHIDEGTLQAVARHGEKLIKAAPERIHYELMKLFSAHECFYHTRLMADTGLLEYIFPELAGMHQVPANVYHHMGLFDHTLELLHQAEGHLKDLPLSLQERFQSAINPFIKRIAGVRMACLLHDVGKPATMAFDPKISRYKFYGHDEVGEQMVWGIAVRQKWGKELTKLVAHLVRWHLYPGDMLRPGITQKAYRRFFRRTGEFLPELVLLAIADRFSAKGPAITEDELQEAKAGLLKLWNLYQTFLAAEETKPRLLTGREIMELLGVEPGPRVGEILSEINEAFLNGELSTKQEAIQWLHAKYKASSSAD